MPRYNPTRDRGTSALEYAAAILVSAAVLASFILVAIPDTLVPKTKSAFCSVFLGKDCGPKDHGGGVIQPVAPAQPGVPVRPVQPAQPGAPVQPVQPVQPVPQAGGGDDRGGRSCKGNWFQKSFCHTGNFLGDAASGTGHWFKGTGLGLWDTGVGIWDGATFIACLVHICSHEGFKSNWGGLGHLVTHPIDSLKAIWDDATKHCKKFFKHSEDAGRCTVGLIGSIVGAKGINKLGKVPGGKKGGGDRPRLPGKVGDLTKEARDAAERAKQAAARGDWVTARKEADLARQKLGDADAEAGKTGCKVGSLGPPRPGLPAAPQPAAVAARVTFRFAALHANPDPNPCQAATQTRTAVEQALRDAAEKRIDQLRSEGPGSHVVQRHLDPSDDRIKWRLGRPRLNPDGTPQLKDEGTVRVHNGTQQDPMSPNVVDPMTNPQNSIDNVDAVTGRPHRVGSYSSAFSDPLDMALADSRMRQNIPPSGRVQLPIENVLGPDAHRRMRGWFIDPNNPSVYRPIDFEGGNVIAIYQRHPTTGDLYLYTMYPNPAPGKNP